MNLFKLVIARYFPLIGDEAYYWLWSRHLDLSYVDHPPMIAYVNYILTTLFGNNEFAIRLGAIGIVLIISWIIYLAGRELYGEKAGAVAAVVFNLLPLFFGGGMFLVPQTLLFLFWALSFYLMVRIVKTGKQHYWYLLGISAGLGLLSDYGMILFLVGVGAYLLFNREQRHWLTRKEPYLGALLALLIFSPVIFWNISHNFPSLSYHGERANIFSLQNILYFLLLQIILFTPSLFVATVMKLGKTDLSGIFSGVVFIPFALLSPFVMVGGHWPAAAYLPSVLSVSHLKKWVFRLTVIFALIINALAFTYYLFLYPVPPGLSPNRELQRYIHNQPQRTVVIANNLGLAALVAFYGKTEVFMPPGRHPQYDLWGKPKLKPGNNVLYFALNESEIAGKLKPLFNKVTIDPQKRIFTKDADIPNKTEIFRCEGFKGGIIP